MRIFCSKAIQYTTAATVYVAYDSPPTCAVYGIGGGLIEAGLASQVCAADSDEYVADTTDALYAHETLYRPRWTMTLNGTTYSVDGSPYEHISTAITPPPGPPTIGTPSIGEEQATFPHTPPSDAGYTSTTIFAIPVLGGTTVEGSGSGGLITVTGLTPGVLYSFHGVAYGAGGSGSDPGNVILATTLPATDIEMPAYLKWWVNDEDEMHEHGPEAFDPSVSGSRRFHDLGRGRTWSLMIECHEPVFFGVRGLGGVMTVPRGQPAGLRDDKGT